MTISFLFIIVASFFLGTFGLGMKYNAPLSWEAFWGIHALTGMLIIPVVWALLVVPDLWQSIISAPSSAVINGMILGFIWGIGGVLFGISIKHVGLSVTYGVVMGLTGAIGALVPYFQMQDQSTMSVLPFIVFGIVVMVVGVSIVAYAGVKRENKLAEIGEEIVGIKRGKEFWTGIIIVTICGVLSSFLNIGFTNASAVADNAGILGASTLNASMAAWVVVLLGAIAFNLLYVIVLLIKNNSWETFIYPGSWNAYKWAVISGIIWFGAMGFYGLGASKLGQLGPVIGWPIFVGLSLLFSNIWAIRTGEWENVNEAKKYLYIGTVVSN